MPDEPQTPTETAPEPTPVRERSTEGTYARWFAVAGLLLTPLGIMSATFPLIIIGFLCALIGLVLGIISIITGKFKSDPPVIINAGPRSPAEEVTPNPSGAIGRFDAPTPPKTVKSGASTTIILSLCVLLGIPLVVLGALYVISTGLERSASNAAKENEQAEIRDRLAHPTALIGAIVTIPPSSATFVIKSFACGPQSDGAREADDYRRPSKFCAVDLTVTNISEHAMDFSPEQIDAVGGDHGGGRAIKTAVAETIAANKSADVFRKGIQPGKSISIRALLVVPEEWSVEYVWVHATTHDGGAVVDVRKSSHNRVVLQPPFVRAPDKMGKTVMEGDLSFVVTTFECEPTLKLNASLGLPPARGHYCSVGVTVSNHSEGAVNFGENQVDGFLKGVLYPANGLASALANANEGIFLKGIRGGESIQAVVLFDVPLGKRLDVVKLHGRYLTPGITVAVN